MNFLPFPEIKTERLLLRQFKDTDVEVIFFLRTDETVNKFIERAENNKTKTKADALKFIDKINTGIKTNQLISWGITLKGQSKMIGSICLWNFSKDNKQAEVGYDLNPAFQGKGIMSEALKCVIDFGFTQLKLDLIEAFTHKGNEPSKRLLEKNGFIFMENRKDEGFPFNLVFEIGVV